MNSFSHWLKGHWPTISRTRYFISIVLQGLVVVLLATATGHLIATGLRPLMSDTVALQQAVHLFVGLLFTAIYGAYIGLYFWLPQRSRRACQAGEVERAYRLQRAYAFALGALFAGLYLLVHL